MRALVFVATCLGVLGVATFASSQQTDPVPMSSSAIYDACIANNQGPPTECACMAGFFGGRLPAEEFRLLSVLNRHVDSSGNVSNMDVARQALVDESNRMGLSQDRFRQAMQRFSTMNEDGAYGDRVCVALRNK